MATFIPPSPDTLDAETGFVPPHPDTIEPIENRRPVLAVAQGPGTIYGLNVDGSVDREDNGRTYAGDNSRDPEYRGVAIPRSAARSIFGSERAAMGQDVRVTNERTGLQVVAPIREIGPAEWTGNVVDLSFALNRELGSDGKDPMRVEVLGPAEGPVQVRPASAAQVRRAEPVEVRRAEPVEVRRAEPVEGLPEGFVVEKGKNGTDDELPRVKPWVADVLGLDRWRDEYDGMEVRRAEVVPGQFRPRVGMVRNAPRFLKNGEKPIPGVIERDEDAPFVTGAFKLGEHGEPVALHAGSVSAEFKPNGPAFVVAGGQVLVDPRRYRVGAKQALDAGALDADRYQELIDNAPLAEAAVAEHDKLVAAAGNSPQLLAVARGAGRGAVALAAAKGGAALGSRLGPVGALVGGVGAMVAGAFTYDEAMKLVAPYNDVVRSLEASAKLEPRYAATGELLTFALPVPGSIARLAAAGEVVAAAKGGAAAAKYVGAQVAGGAATGAGVDAALQGVANVLGVQDGWSPESTVQNALLGGALAGHGLKFGNVSDAQVGEILRRGLAGEGFQSRAEADIFEKAMGQVAALRAAGAGGGRPEFSGRQVDMAAGPATVREARLGWSGAGGLLEAPEAPVAGPAGGGAAAAAEFERRAGMSRALVPVENGLVPVQDMGAAARMESAGGSPVYVGQNFVDRGGPGPVFQGGGNELAGRTPLAGLLPEGFVVDGTGGRAVPAVTEPVKRRRFSRDFISTGYTPLMEWMATEMPLRRSRSGAEGGENDGKPSARELGGFANLVHKANGDGPDAVAQAAYENGLIKGPSADDLYAAMRAEVRTYRNVREALKAQEAAQAAQERMDKNFQREVLKPAKGRAPVPVNGLNVGDVVVIGEENLRVTHVDADSFDVTLEDGKRYGVQGIEDGKVIYADDVIRQEEVDFPKTPVAPTIARNGEGNLFHEADMPFNLLGEVDITPELQRAADAKRAAAEAQARADAMQGDLLDGSNSQAQVRAMPKENRAAENQGQPSPGGRVAEELLTGESLRKAISDFGVKIVNEVPLAGRSTEAEFDERTDVIRLNPNVPKSQIDRVLRHEFEHAKQKRLGTLPASKFYGETSSASEFMDYYTDPSEVAARAAESGEQVPEIWNAVWAAKSDQTTKPIRQESISRITSQKIVPDRELPRGTTLMDWSIRRLSKALRKSDPQPKTINVEAIRIKLADQGNGAAAESKLNDLGADAFSSAPFTVDLVISEDGVPNEKNIRFLAEMLGEIKSTALQLGRPESPAPSAGAEATGGMKRPLGNAEGGFADLGAAMEAVEELGRRVYRRGMGFARWAREMVMRAGVWVKEHLLEVWRRVTGQDLMPWARERGAVGDLSVKIDGKYVPKEMAHLDRINPAGMPELVRLARELTGETPVVKKLGRGARGVAKFQAGTARIELDPVAGADPTVAAKVIAHEIGHVVDFVPDATLKRGNILGRLAVLKEFLGSTFPIDDPRAVGGISSKRRQEMRREAERAVGARPAKDNDADLAEWQAAVSGKYRELVQAEMDAKGMAYSGKDSYLPNVREELIALTDWWNPFLSKDGLSEGYLKYRMSSKELYAEMISVLLNDPAGMKERAPTAYEMFFNYLDKKPEAKRALFELWDWMHKPAHERLAERRAGVLGMFRSGAELMERKVAARARAWTLEGFRDGLRTFLDTKYWPIIKRERAAAAAGNVGAQQHLIEWFFDQHPLADNDVFLWLNGVQERVRGPLNAAGISEEDLGEFLMWDRIANERYDINQKIGDEMVKVGEGGRAVVFNPQGHTPTTALDQLEHLEMLLGPEKFKELRRLAGVFHDEFFKLSQGMRDEGMIGDETWRIVEENRGHYAAFVPLEYADLYVSAGIRKQMGTLKDIQNPWVSTVLKGITTIRAIEMNRAKRMTLDGLRTMFPDEITLAKTVWDGKGQRALPPKDPELALLSVSRGGKREDYYVPEDVAGMFEDADQSLLAQVVGPLDYTWRNIFYPIFITYNPLFQFIRNPIRDTRRTALNLPHGAGPERAVTMRLTNARMVREFVEHGVVSPEIGAALEARAITPPMGTWQSTSGPGGDEFLAIARRFGLVPELPPGWMQSNLLTRRVAALGERIKIAGQVRELLPKVGTFKILTRELGWGPDEAGYFVRNHVGTPNYTKQGTLTRVANDIFPFTNVWLKAWQADIRLARRGFQGKAGAGKKRKSAASWWMRWMLTSGSLRVLQAAGAVGLLGAGIKRMYDRVGDYWMTNYDVLPIGETDGGDYDGLKTVMAVLPRDPTDRILGGIVYQFTKAALLTGMGKEARLGDLMPKGLALATSDTPGINPAIKIANGWRQYAQGQNPYDSFRAKNVLTNQEELAGGWPAVKSMLAWSVSQTGAQNFVQYNPNSGSFLEIVLGAIPGINGLVKVTDNGLREQLEVSGGDEDKAKARAALSMPEPVLILRRELNYLRSVGADKRSPLMEARYQYLSAWNREVYEPAVEAALINPAEARFYGSMAESMSRPLMKRVK